MRLLGRWIAPNGPESKIPSLKQAHAKVEWLPGWGPINIGQIESEGEIGLRAPRFARQQGSWTRSLIEQHPEHPNLPNRPAELLEVNRLLGVSVHS